MKTKYIIILLSLLSLLISCHDNKKSYDEISSDGITIRTQNLRNNLFNYEDKGTMLGQMYGTTEGIGWIGDSARSDLFEICDDKPSCIGFEIAGAENNAKTNTDKIPFSIIKKDILDFFHSQGLVTMSWTAPNPGKDVLDDGSESNKQLEIWSKNIAEYIGSIKDGYGIKVPIVLSLFPIGTGQWYDKMSVEDYKKLYETTMKWMKESELTNAIFSYSSAEMPTTAEQFMTRCPKEGIDMIQFLYYTKEYKGYNANLTKMTKMLSTYCTSVMKPFGLATGVRMMGNDDNFWTTNIEPLIKSCRISYIMLGHNHGDFKDGDYYGPYPGNKTVADFMKLYNNPHIMMRSKLNGLMLEH